MALLDAALSLCPRHEEALELKARSLLFLRRFRDVADMLQHYIPSYRLSSDDDSNTSLSSDNSSSAAAVAARERAQLLPSVADEDDGRFGPGGFRCFSVSELKRKLVAGLSRNSDREGPWR